MGQVIPEISAASATLTRSLGMVGTACFLQMLVHHAASLSALGSTWRVAAAADQPCNVVKKPTMLLPCERAIERHGSVAVRLPPLSRMAIAELAQRGAGRSPPPEILDEIVTVSAGLAGACALLVRSWITRLRGGKPDAGALAESDLDMARLLDASFSSLSQAGREHVLAMALSTGVEEATGFDDGGVADAEARAGGWLRATGPSSGEQA